MAGKQKQILLHLTGFTHSAYISLCVIVLYVHACCIIVTWWDEPGEIESYLDN